MEVDPGTSRFRLVKDRRYEVGCKTKPFYPGLPVVYVGTSPLPSNDTSGQEYTRVDAETKLSRSGLSKMNTLEKERRSHPDGGKLFELLFC